MGVWAKGPSPKGIDVAGIAEVMRPILEEWMTAHIQIYDARRYSDNAPALVYDSGENGAIVQPLRAPRDTVVGGQGNAIMGIRFQVKRGGTQPGQKLRGGLLVKVIDGGNASGLGDYVFALPETIDSSLMWDYIFEATVVTGGQ